MRRRSRRARPRRSAAGGRADDESGDDCRRKYFQIDVVVFDPRSVAAASPLEFTLPYAAARRRLPHAIFVPEVRAGADRWRREHRPACRPSS